MTQPPHWVYLYMCVCVYVIHKNYMSIKACKRMFPNNITQMLCPTLRVMPLLLALVVPPPPNPTSGAKLCRMRTIISCFY